MSLIEIYVLYDDAIQIEYFNNLVKILKLDNNIHLVYEKYHNTTKFAYEKYVFINDDVNYKTTNNFIILLNEECSTYNEYIDKINLEDSTNIIHIFSMNPCFEAFLISHFISNFIDLQEKCKAKNLLNDDYIDKLERIGKEVNTSCNHCEHYIRSNSFIEDYEKNCLAQVSKYIKHDKILNSYNQVDILPKLITYFTSLLPNIRS